MIIEGKLIGSIRYCSSDTSSYTEAETYKGVDGKYYNIVYTQHRKKEEGVYTIYIKEDNEPLVKPQKGLKLND